MVPGHGRRTSHHQACNCPATATTNSPPLWKGDAKVVGSILVSRTKMSVSQRPKGTGFIRDHPSQPTTVPTNWPAQGIFPHFPEPRIHQKKRHFVTQTEEEEGKNPSGLLMIRRPRTIPTLPWIFQRPPEGQEDQGPPSLPRSPTPQQHLSHPLPTSSTP